MSHEMEERIRALTNIDDMNPSFVLWAGSLEDAKKWDKLIHYLAEFAEFGAETGYDTYPLKDESGLLCWLTFKVLREMGVRLPNEFPTELDVDYESDNDGISELTNELVLEKNPYSSLIYKIFKSLIDVYGFYTAYIDELVNDDDLELLDTAAANIEPCLIDLAACKIEVDPALAPKFAEFKYRVSEEYVEWLTLVKEKAFRAGIPLRAELLHMVRDSHDELGHEAEAQSLGFNSSRLHPDIYMNELLCGMRAIHQVLPAIMKKLGIEEEFKLDTSEFYVR
jgi:hypothetical protein